MAEISKEFTTDSTGNINCHWTDETFRHTIQQEHRPNLQDIASAGQAFLEDLLAFEPPVRIQPEDVRVDLSEETNGIWKTGMYLVELTYSRHLRYHNPSLRLPDGTFRVCHLVNPQEDGDIQKITKVPDDFTQRDLDLERRRRNQPGYANESVSFEAMMGARRASGGPKV